MPSSKGKPTDPKLREKVKEEVKNETNKDGGGKGQWSAWKVSAHYILCYGLHVHAFWRCTYCARDARHTLETSDPYQVIKLVSHPLTPLQATKLSKEYEKRGGNYENSPGSKNEPAKGTPQPKSSGKKKSEEKKSEDKQVDKEESPSPQEEEKEDKGNEKPKANTAKKAKPAKGEEKTSAARGRPKGGKAGGAAKKKGDAPVEGTRKSSRVAKRKADEGEGEEKKKAK